MRARVREAFGSQPFDQYVTVTVLFNPIQPLIRYELSDSLRLAPQPCAWGVEPLKLAGARSLAGAEVPPPAGQVAYAPRRSVPDPSG